MNRPLLVLRGLTYYWRTNAAVVLGVATAVAVLAGALLVGDSVRGSLRDLVVQRLGRTDQIVVSSGFFREALADDLRADEAFKTAFTSICPLIVVQGVVTDQTSGRRASRVPVYGVDARFWQFHGVIGATVEQGPEDREALVSAALAADIGTSASRAVLVRVERPSAVPIESLHGRKEDVGRTMRLNVRAVVGPANLGEFSLQPRQGAVRAVFVPLKRLQQEIGLDGRVNTLLVSARIGGQPDRPRPSDGDGVAVPTPLETLVRRTATLEDVGLRLRAIESPGVIAVESAAGLLDPARTTAVDRAASAASMVADPVFTYLANTLRSGEREIPYSLVTAIDLKRIAPDARVLNSPGSRPPVILNEWAAKDLGVHAGDPLALDYYVWEEPGRLKARSADFQVAAVVPIAGAAADRNLAPVFPGITESATLAEWDPPFPIDLRRVRRVDEDYWKEYRTTPKAFIPLDVGQMLWRSRYGDRTSMRVVPPAGESLTESLNRFTARLRAVVDPVALGIAVQDVRAEGVAASRGATDFGEYFTYFSFFLVLSALLLAALFFKLGVEQRAREIGLLRAVGYTTAQVRRLFLGEGLLLTFLGSVIGVFGAIGYASMMMTGLGSWWAGAVGTTALRLHLSFSSLAAGVLGAVAAAMACIWWSMRGLGRLSERSLLAGTLVRIVWTSAGRRGSARSPLAGAIAFGLLGAAFAAATAAGTIDRTGAFFGAGTSLLVASLCAIAFVLRRPSRQLLQGRGWWSVARLGLRNASDRPGRSVLAIAVIASATFILISVDAFRRVGPAATDRQSGVGGYALLVELLLPLAHDPNGAEGRDLLGLTSYPEATLEPFRLLPGDDASCLNLYAPSRPRVLGATRAFIESGRFSFQSSLASSEAERRNPWLLLNRRLADDKGPIAPVIADANSMTYVLHKKLGDDVVVDQGGRPVRMRLVAALDDSIFQSELLMSDVSFLSLFPGQDGYQVLLVDTPPERAPQVAAAIQEGGRDFGPLAISTTERLAEFHRVENTYISTFQTLGGLGLLIGTVGLAAVLLRNVLERRRDLALLGAVGYRKAHVFAIVLAENLLLLGWGLAVGAFCALVAVVPALLDRGGRLPATSGGWVLVAAVFVAGLLSSIVATRAVLRGSLLAALRAE
jgi:putative ABC transport system permease protein